MCEKANSVTDFGNSWVVRVDECPDIIPEPTDPCEGDSDATRESEELCAIILDRDGPFAPCHDFRDPDPFYDSCTYDVCALGEEYLCDSLAEYAEACRQSGGQPGDWRAETPVCPFECPENTVYDACASGCPETCSSASSSVSCNVTCQETCRCPDDQVLDGDRCVYRSECGCTLDNNVYIQPGESWTRPDCSEQCQCVNGRAECQVYTCGRNAECEVRNGQPSCYCQEGFTSVEGSCIRAPGFCQVWGDPHYITFDQRKYNFQGDCDYTLVKDCLGSSSFHLWADNEKRLPTDKVSYIRELVLEDSNNTYSLIYDFKVRVNGIDYSKNLPYIGDGIIIFRTFKSLANSVTDFGNSWVVRVDECPDIIPEPTDPCEGDSDATRESEELCAIILDRDGPFAPCHDFRDPDPFYDSCTYDVCALGEEYLCDSLAEYAEACRQSGGQPGDWRAETPVCPFECPENTVYDACASGCPETCSSASSSVSCNVTCQETCRCPDDQVLDGDRCVYRSECGCTLDNNVYIQPGESWTRPDCSEQCQCVNGRAECQVYTCGRNAECEVRNGQPSCYCQEGFTSVEGSCIRAPGFCQVWGDPHYITFDQRKYNFQGDCDYTLVKDCLGSNSFHLWADNEKRLPTDEVSYIRELVLEDSNNTYSLIYDFKVRVNGIDYSKNLPYIGDGIIIFRTFKSLKLLTNYMWISYDGRRSADIFLSYSYWNQSCGLCGTFDGDRSNDWTLPNGDLANSVTDFGNSWVVRVDECPDIIPEPTDPCEGDSDATRESEELCAIILDRDGPFAPCHDFRDPDPFYDSCTYDVCALGEEYLCDSLAEYAEACRQSGGQPGDWRAETPVCPFECPENTVYDACASGCPETCSSASSSVSCNVTCQETCRCPDDQVLDGDRCVYRSECGCTLDNNVYIQPGESWTRPDCSEQCQCVNGRAECQVYTCGRNAECEVRNGQPSCYCQEGFTSVEGSCIRAPGFCQVWGDPHYITFDQRKYNFQGDCDYTLVKDCLGSNSFHLWADNEKRLPTDEVSYIRELVLEDSNNTYSLIYDFKVRVNGIDYSKNLPYIGDGIIIFRTFKSLKLLTNYMWISYDGRRSADIFLSYSYWNQSCGLCGTFDGDRSNDWTLPNGDLANSVTDFGNSWVVRVDECPDIIPEPTDPCEGDSDATRESEELCAIILDRDGPFAPCHDFRDPDPFYDSCTYDVCALGEEYLCDSLAEYAEACRQSGGQPGDWRAETPVCPFECPENTVYDACASGCPETCSSASSSVSCNVTCQETCRCPDDQVLDGDRCVYRSECGCTLDNNVYIQPGESWTRPDCSEQCQCVNGRAECQVYTCGRNAECEVRNGQPSCYCQEGFTSVEGSCIRAPGFCQVWGDPHYITFDQRKYNFQGDCDYTLVKDCLGSNSFHLWADNEKRLPTDEVSYIRELVLEDSNNTYSLIYDFKVRVNGIDYSKNLPYIGDGIIIFRTFKSLKLLTNYMWISYDGRRSADIFLSYSYWNQSCGLCGTFDGDRSNDWTLPNGDLVSIEFR
ncbi:IgGFc-binding protein-like [Diadema setosum]|uniref:IgGFc-binding protein-like n=1 Tax=Diadema setosum TaxID=31175 RepID=UPI003B3A26F2